MDFTKTSGFKWTKNRDKAVLSLAQGETVREAAEAAKVSTRTIYTWLTHPEFCIERDKLTHMVGEATRAGRLRIALQVIKGRTDSTQYPQSKADLLDWLKFVQSETDGVKLDITAVLAAAASVAGSGSDRPAELSSGNSRNGRTVKAP